MRKGMAASVRPLVHATSCDADRGGATWMSGGLLTLLLSLPHHFASARYPGSTECMPCCCRAAKAAHQRDIGLDEVVAGVEAGGEALALPLLHKVAQQVLGDVAVARLWRWAVGEEWG